jgi:hypothetical protein
MLTVLHEQRRTDWPDTAADGDHLWLDRQSIEQATGWTWKPEGLCYGDDLCVPLPRGADMIRGDRLDLAAAWRRSGQPVVHDAAARVWVLGTGAARRGTGLAAGTGLRVAGSRRPAAPAVGAARAQGLPRDLGVVVRLSR